ncbi:diguanylate cyclase domain-containing protein [Cryptosporangium sp. NPDC048952]|uniref:GGDEF domain-containing protein n=1 Tax=Cryptosporangium sp. NPDC048952 TaxID=3363961 RepID=UPI003720A428
MRGGRAPGHVTAGFLGACGVATVLFYVVPRPGLQMSVCGVLGVASAIAIVVGVAWRRPAVRWSWYVLALSRVIYGAGDVIYWYQTVFQQRDVFPSVSDAFYIPSNLMLIVALAGLARARSPGHDEGRLIDALVLSTGVAMLAWIFLMSPYVHDGGLTGFGEAVSLAYPAIDVLALGILVRLTLGGGDRTRAFWFLTVGVFLQLVADVGYLLLELAGTYLAGNPLDAGWFALHALAGAAALHPSMTALSSASPPVDDFRIGRGRLVALAAASLMAPAALAIQWLRGAPLDVPVIVLGCVVLFLLVITRLHGTLRLLSVTLQTAETQARTDQLTGLANRRSFHSVWERTLRDGSGPTALLYVDLDGFKPVNDAFGHEAGDAVLIAVADRLRDVVREGDVVARLGGDEFALILPESSDADARQVADRILVALAEPVVAGGEEVVVGASIGLVAAARGDDAEGWLHRADAAMYAAKAAGRGRVVQSA